MENDRKKSLIPVIAASVLMFLFYFRASVWSQNGRFTNIQLYILGTVVFFAVLLAAEFLVHKTKLYEVNQKCRMACGCLLAVWGMYFFYKAYQLEIRSFDYPPSYFRHHMPKIIYLYVLVISVAAAVLLIHNKAGQKNKWIRYAISGLVVLLQTWFMYAPNCFRDNCGGLYHMDAYTNSIINALHYAPYEQYSMAIYGHYGIFYILPIKIFQYLGANQWIAVTFTIAALGGLVFFIEYWVLSQMVENDFVFIIAVLGNSIVSTQIYFNQFYQMLPHRYVFQAIILAGILLTYRAENNRRKLYKAVMWILAGAAVVWNTETGLVSAAVCMLGMVYLDAKEKGKWRIGGGILKNFLFLAASCVGAYLFVNLYNLLVGGNAITVGTFLYPLGSKSYPVESIQMTLQVPWAGYFTVLLAALVTLGFYFWDILELKLGEKQLLVVLSAVMGYGVFTYYMNRAFSTNASISTFTLILILAYVCDQGHSFNLYRINSIKQISVRNVALYLCITVMTSMAISSVATYGGTMSNKDKTVYEMDSLEQFLGEVRAGVPEGTAAFGIGTAQLYAYMDWETGIYISDWEDLDQSFTKDSLINQEALDYLLNALAENQYPYILVNKMQEKYVPENYDFLEEFEYCGFTFKLYGRGGM